ncbi:MAG TPA: sugar ABC transporter permease [Rectinema sp.]|jgi:alpha-glucoside transport system permease protein|nr:sugar ABC transporter permease [Rectinema sp.]HOD58980.1 sugar ABC transporter permease [Rectinema sp.]HOE76499.1 sugar ABC transporter permease [Rectinema sp.]HOH05405.1 sugar ABC transporter permease [Rectinema sp.]HOR49348.1 sugar ABC transporter permease [Rectinema sp.]
MKVKRDSIQGWLFLAPALILLVAYLVYPCLSTLKMSFYGGQGFSPKRFVGFANYARLLGGGDSLFLNLKWPPSGALINNILWILFFAGGTVVIGLAIAVLADGLRLEKIFKSLIFLPMIISATAASVIFRFLYSPDPHIGLLNALISSISPGKKPIPWLGSTDIVNIALIGAGIWIWTGLSMTVLSAAYKSLDREILEAAKVDGASSWTCFWRISLPMLEDQIVFVAITMIINSLKLVDLVLVMTGGGPMGSSRTIGFSFYWEVFNNNLVGYGSAIAMILLILLIPFMVFQVRRIKAQESYR